MNYDAVADRGVRITEEDKRGLDQNGEIDSTPLASVLLVEIAAVGPGIADALKIKGRSMRNTANSTSGSPMAGQLSMLR